LQVPLLNPEIIAICEHLALRLAWSFYNPQWHPGYDLEDLVSVAMVRAVQKYPTFDLAKGRGDTLGTRVVAYFWRPMRWAILRELHQQGQRVTGMRISELSREEGSRPIEESIAGIDDSEPMLDISDELDWRLRHVSSRGRRILFLRYGMGMTQVEVGQVLGVSHATISIAERSLQRTFGLSRPQLSGIRHGKRKKKRGIA